MILIVFAILLFCTIWSVASAAQARLKLADVVERKGMHQFIETGKVICPRILRSRTDPVQNTNYLPDGLSLALYLIFSGALVICNMYFHEYRNRCGE